MFNIRLCTEQKKNEEEWKDCRTKVYEFYESIRHLLMSRNENES